MLHFHNTLSGKAELFTSFTPGKVRMYVCGVTPYDSSHIGHAQAMVTFDVVYRYLKFLGYDVTFIRNFTDVDDKIINRANERGISPSSTSTSTLKTPKRSVVSRRPTNPERHSTFPK
mgnify:CR=1 FL=1